MDFYITFFYIKNTDQNGYSRNGMVGISDHKSGTERVHAHKKDGNQRYKLVFSKVTANCIPKRIK